MKKLLVVLLSMGLIAAFSMTASAADVKFSGSYYVVGFYSSNPQLADTDRTYSKAAYWQRIRVEPVFQVAEGLSFTARWDAMEKGWGNTNWRGGFDDMTESRPQTPAYGNPSTQENFEWERGYVTFLTKYGQFDIGYQSTGKWGTDFMDDEKSRPRVKFTTKVGNFIFVALLEKQFDSVYSSQTYGTTAQPYSTRVDADNDQYALAAIYNFDQGNVGLLYKYVNNRSTRPAQYVGYETRAHSLLPYIKATFGPIYIESELVYVFGKAAQFDKPAVPIPQPADKDWSALAAYAKARMNVGPGYFGVAAQYIPGDDNGDATKKTDVANASGNGSQDLDVGLLLGNDALQTWRNGASGGAYGTSSVFSSAKYNSILYSAFGGYNPTPKLNLQAMLVYGQLDKIPVSTVANRNDSKKLGTEIDLTASYKIYDNLTYMVGAAYLWAGDAFKGFDANSNDNKVGNDYLLLNKISLSF